MFVECSSRKSEIKRESERERSEQFIQVRVYICHDILVRKNLYVLMYLSQISSMKKLHDFTSPNTNGSIIESDFDIYFSYMLLAADVLSVCIVLLLLTTERFGRRFLCFCIQTDKDPFRLDITLALSMIQHGFDF